MSTLRALIFDFDGVIANTEPLHFAGLHQTLKEIGIDLTEADYYANYLGYDDHGCFVAALTAHHRLVDSGTIAQLMKRKASAYLESVKRHQVIFAGVPVFIREAARLYPLAIASGALRHEIEYILEAAGLRKEFFHITSAEDVLRGKPDPQPFMLAMKGLQQREPGLTPGSCLVIEDSLPGVRGAKAAGMKVLAVANTHTVQDLHEADAITPSLQETNLTDLRRHLWQEP
ncbi:MAG: putative Beta-phosphoglucomutase [Nitrospira sp.]|jgi:beta-phosphoglucomutase-like phosphatase (HAD superfamily)|nr:putative Beta-phosphoglucomutase [Nitrospira sp.]